MASDQASTDQPSPEQSRTESSSEASGDESGMDELTLGPDKRKAHTPEDMATPHQAVQAQDFMDRNAGVHGFGVGQDADGSPCMVLFADDLPADQVPESLDGLPVRVEGSEEFTAGG